MEITEKCRHHGRTIVQLDFGGVKDTDEIKNRIAAYRPFIASHPKRSLLVLTNLTGCAVNKQTVEFFKEFTAHNKPYIIASAAFGLTGFTRIFVNAVNSFSKRDIAHFDDPEKAKNWLVTRS
ncbi:MAG: hypothetical protein JXA71_16095 [Chitinispirillaceae bacterium]|nr:hypothetical protein [Chitinispirillaceae bacterium]